MLAGARVAALALLLGGLLAAAAPAAPPGSPWDEKYFSNVPLVTHEGRLVRFYDDLIRDKVVVINFIYTTCKDACPLETARLVQVQELLGDRMGRDVFFYSITVDPKRDTPPVLKEYAARFGVGPGWLFLTGKREDVTLIRKKVGLAARRGEDEVRDHSASMVLGNDATGQWTRHIILDNPKYLAVMIGDWLSDWKGARPVKSYAEVPRIVPPERGEYLFRTRCAACHTIGAGDGLGPDLLGVTAQRDRAWLVRWLKVPDKMLEEGDPIAVELEEKYKKVQMPNLRLNDADAHSLIAYMESESAKAARATSRVRHAPAPNREPGEP
jgi:protein SCO1/2